MICHMAQSLLNPDEQAELKKLVRSFEFDGKKYSSFAYACKITHYILLSSVELFHLRAVRNQAIEPTSSILSLPNLEIFHDCQRDTF